MGASLLRTASIVPYSGISGFIRKWAAQSVERKVNFLRTSPKACKLHLCISPQYTFTTPQDLREIFDTIESIPNAPKKLLEGFKSWARGEQDPTWKKK